MQAQMKRMRLDESFSWRVFKKYLSEEDYVGVDYSRIDISEDGELVVLREAVMSDASQPSPNE